jgi:hypothetical protein
MKDPFEELPQAGISIPIYESGQELLAFGGGGEILRMTALLSHENNFPFFK